MQARECSDCNLFLSLGDFAADARGWGDGLNPRCESCRAERRKNVYRRYHDSHPELKKKAQDRKLAKIGWTPQARAHRHALLGGICENPGCDRLIKATDHDHATGLARFLLCHYCNWALGAVGDDIARLQGLIDLLQQHDLKTAV